jgi:hypothetical protein
MNAGSGEEISNQAYVVDQILGIVFPNWNQEFPDTCVKNWGGGHHEVAL